MKRRKLVAAAAAAAVFLIAGVSACGPKTYNDGSYTGISQGGKQGYAIAQVTVRKDKVASVKLTEMTELGLLKDFQTYPWPKAKEARDTLEKAFVGKKDNKVDAVAQATQSSRKYIEAVGHALEKARKTPAVKSTYFDGTYQGSSKGGEQGWGVAWVTVKGDKIIAVEVEDVTPEKKFKDWATYGYTKALEAKVEMPKRFVAANAATVDAYSGATASSAKWMEAVSEALKAAKVR